MTFTVRPLSDAEWPAFIGVAYEAFNSSYPLELADKWKEVVEIGRCLAAVDGDLLVGTAGALSFTMTVPGGPIPVAGVTSVAVLPSHRRRGVLSALMRRQLDDLHTKGEAVAALYASEAGIYGRFGYGRAADNLFFRIPTRGSAFVPGAPADPSLRLRVAQPLEAHADLRRVFDAVVRDRPGLYARSDATWRVEVLNDSDHARGGNGPLRCMIVEDDAGPRGYALFRVRRGTTDHDVPDGEVQLFELFATDPAAYALTWRSVLDRDLCSHVHAVSRPVDDPIVHLLAEPRNLNAGWLDELWIRLVDVGRALASRTYAAPADLVIEVDDRVCPWNSGRWRLDTEKGACERTDQAPDLSLPVDVLGAAYLGGRPLQAFAGAGLVREHRKGAARELSTAMSWDPKPWAGLVF
ncbi:GNAT family N-acetyltransferase [Microbispora sp. RL4-1S]|uniref:GNAT family N-acetyltransferase n=1 Tax=Microbispora oryzae TaxID=2806554 RepID=A0A940WNS8_9ACTN|nr:GNAT family N-acetyltransferase [Microbispora oryzae]MBP2708308.1 GNAT family N-acetyltransferase [Microbispora oryzae]